MRPLAWTVHNNSVAKRKAKAAEKRAVRAKTVDREEQRAERLNKIAKRKGNVQKGLEDKRRAKMARRAEGTGDGGADD